MHQFQSQAFDVLNTYNKTMSSDKQIVCKKILVFLKL